MTDRESMAGGPCRLLTRRAVIRWLGAGTVGAATVRAMASAPARAAPARPNIILILLDDLRYDDIAAMPAVQTLLAAEGASFRQFIATSPSCAPSRASIFRGQHPHNHGVLRGSGNVGGLDEYLEQGNEASHIATWLQDAGYRTALIGKYLNGYRETVAETYVPPGWDEWDGVTQEGYSRFEINHNGTVTKYRSGQGEQYSTDMFAALSETFVREAAASGTPFFLHLSPRAPHGPAEPPERHAAAYAEVTAPRGPAFNEADVSAKPSWVQVLPPLTAADEEQIDAYHRTRWQTLLAVDDLVSGLIATLEQTEALNNTYVVLTSDNGYHLGEHRVVQEKGTPYEESLHMPLLVRGPGIAPGVSIDALATQADLAPTFAAWARVPVPEFVDGRSLAPLLAGDALLGAWRQVVIAAHYVNKPDRLYDQPAFAALRGTGFTYVEYGNGQRELYDLITDPYQLDNLVETAAPALLVSLAARLEEMRTCAGESCRVADAEPVPALVAFGRPSRPSTRELVEVVPGAAEQETAASARIETAFFPLSPLSPSRHTP